MQTIDGGAINILTEIQARCLIPGIAGKDILAKSNTGSGKTLAFLMVGVERIVKYKGPNPYTSFPIVILTPVTDLAVQIMQVAKRLLKYHNMVADLVIGGTNEAKDIARLTKNRIDVLVATPGRFKSILNQSPKIKERLSLCQTFVIDEADKMTDPGFLNQTKFIHVLAKNPRMQTLMFSATMDRTKMMSFGFLKRTALFIDVMPNTKPQVNTKVKQICIITNIANHLDALVSVVKEQIRMSQQSAGSYSKSRYINLSVNAQKLSIPTQKALREWETGSLSGYRIMIFLPSNAFIDYIAKVFKTKLPEVKILTLHGGMLQSARSRTSETFRTTSNCVLFTSDASARGVDYPDVSCIVQIGFDNRSEYLQRVGRTGRAGKDGVSYLISAPEENTGVEMVCDVLNEIYVDKDWKGDKPKCINKLMTKPYVSSHISYPKPTQDAKKAYRGWLGSLASKWKRLKMPPQSVVNMAQGLSIAMGLGEVPLEKLYDKLAIKIKKQY